MYARANAFGTTEDDFVDGLAEQLLNAGTQGQKYDARGPNFMLSVVQGVVPKDEMEAMLAARMAAVHLDNMTFARRACREHPPTGQRLERLQQAGADVRGADGGAETL